MNRMIGKLLVFFALFSFVFSGCHYFSANKEMDSAWNLFTDLREKGGEKLVPYEYCSAEKFLEISKKEFNSNDFKTSEGFAKRSISASKAGLVEIQKKK